MPKPPWRARKEAYIAHLRDPDLPDGALRVSLADKLHNARAILFDLHAGHDVYARFSAGREDQLWYYGELAETFAELSDRPDGGRAAARRGELRELTHTARVSARAHRR
jgi:hypothetical protein